jgi:uridine kinase
VSRDARLGSFSVLVLTSLSPSSYSVRLPSFIRSKADAPKAFVFLADAQIGTGAAAFMAIRVLLDHGVSQERIVFITLLASAKGGIHALEKAFPKVRIVVAGIAPGLRKTRMPYKPEPASRSAGGDASLQLSPPPLELDAGRGGLSAQLFSESMRKEQEEEGNKQRTRVCYALAPGAGNLGNRYWRT